MFSESAPLPGNEAEIDPQFDGDAAEMADAEGSQDQIRGKRRLSSMAAMAVIFALLANLTFYYSPWWPASTWQTHAGGIWCEEVQPRLIDYVNDRVDPEIEPKMKMHLSKCPICSKLVPPKTELARAPILEGWR